MSLSKLLNGVQSMAVICNQWGDTGKGKFSDYFASWADVIARGTGGNNAGHTVVVGDKKRIFHLVPSGIAQDPEGKVNILGNGMVLDLRVLNEELDALDEAGMTYDNLRVSEDAHIILPYHIDKDRRKHQSMDKGGIGSTGRGIGPAYTDMIARSGVMVRDLFDKDRLAAKIKKNLSSYGVPDGSSINTETEHIIEELTPCARRIKPFVRDTVAEIQEAHARGDKILLEGAQGLLLSYMFGSYPYVTSSDPSLNGTATGVGLPAKAIDLPLGIVKFPMMTRVGGGPFPTEFGGMQSEYYCNDGAGEAHKVAFELERYGINCGTDGRYDHEHPNIIKLLNSPDPFERGVGYRLAADEYGATTKRPRRTGRTDLAALKYAVGINGPHVILTKVDVAKGAEEIELGIGYEEQDRFSRHPDVQRGLTPAYKTFNGFKTDITGAKSMVDLPQSLQEAIEFTQEFAGCRVRAISVGADREDTIICD